MKSDSLCGKMVCGGFFGAQRYQDHPGRTQELKRLPDALELALFRILQESLTNVHRYSNSQAVEIQVELGRNEITLQVKDYGQGMRPDVLERFRIDGGGVGWPRA